MVPVQNTTLEAKIGMICLGLSFTSLGLYFIQRTLFKGEIMRPAAGWYVIRYKITGSPVTFGYLYAFLYTLLFGPALVLLGIIGLGTFIAVQFFM